MPEYVEVKIKGYLDERWKDWFAGLHMAYLQQEQVTLLTGCLPDQSALHGLIERIRDLNLKLISVTTESPPSDIQRKGKMMTTVKKFIQKHAVLIYFVLTVIFTWGGMALAVYPGGFPISDEQLAAAGPLVYMAMLIGPTGAALILTPFAEGRGGFRALFSPLFRRKVNVRWYLIAILTVPVLVTIILSVLSLFNPAFRPMLFTADNKAGLILSSIAAGLAVGFFEELGWTGFAVPRMKKRRTVLATGLIVGIVWGAWHFPPFWTAETFTAPLPFLLLLAQLFTWLPAYRILMVWVYDRTESLFIAVLMHASLMGSLNALVPSTLATSELLTWILSWAGILWLIVVLGTIIQKRKAT